VGRSLLTVLYSRHRYVCPCGFPGAPCVAPRARELDELIAPDGTHALRAINATDMTVASSTHTVLCVCEASNGAGQFPALHCSLGHICERVLRWTRWSFLSWRTGRRPHPTVVPRTSAAGRTSTCGTSTRASEAQRATTTAVVSRVLFLPVRPSRRLVAVPALPLVRWST
jgi:hypothetical protein